MAVILRNSIFLHIPKTGGTWVANVLARACPGALLIRSKNEVAHERVSHLFELQDAGWPESEVQIVDAGRTPIAFTADVRARLEEIDFARCRYFCFVREPAEFWLSFWRYRRWNGWDPHHLVDLACRDDSFPQFVRNIVERIPGWCSDMYRSFTEPECGASVQVGRCEHLRRELLAMLSANGETFDRGVIETTPELNASPRYDGEYDSLLLAAIKRAEQDAYQRYYPELLPSASADEDPPVQEAALRR